MLRILVGLFFLIAQETPSYRSHLAVFPVAFQKAIVQHRVYRPAMYSTSKLQGMAAYTWQIRTVVKGDQS